MVKNLPIGNGFQIQESLPPLQIKVLEGRLNSSPYWTSFNQQNALLASKQTHFLFLSLGTMQLFQKNNAKSGQLFQFLIVKGHLQLVELVNKNLTSDHPHQARLLPLFFVHNVEILKRLHFHISFNVDLFRERISICTKKKEGNKIWNHLFLSFLTSSCYIYLSSLTSS